MWRRRVDWEAVRGEKWMGLVARVIRRLRDLLLLGWFLFDFIIWDGNGEV
tara:strand:+ start:800 stop:949 length:150 start_codon:yes stop_codon:yes gene_type:complete